MYFHCTCIFYFFLFLFISFPGESRVLTNPTTRIPQGTLECWIEMYEPSIAVDIPVVPIAPPKVTDWEMRVVIWETRKVPKLREKRSMNMYTVGEFIYFSAEDSTRGPQVQPTPPESKSVYTTCHTL